MAANVTKPALPDTAESAHSLLRELLDRDFFAQVEQSVTDDRGRWVPDPSVPGVWAFLVAGEPVVVVYLDSRNFEANDEWFR